MSLMQDQESSRPGGVRNSSGELRTYLAVLWHRKWIVLPLVVVTPLVAYIIGNNGTPVFQASSQVLLNRQSQGISQVSDPTLFDPARLVRTQSQVARAPAIASQVVEAAGLTERGPGGFLGQSSVSGDDTSDLLTFSVRDGDPELAAKLANLYATSYIAYRQRLETIPLARATPALRRQVDRIRRAGQTDSQLYASLSQQLEQLNTAQELTKSNAQLIRSATGAGQIEPRPMRLAYIGLALGLILGLGCAFLVDAFDGRMRSAEQLAEATGLTLLARLPTPQRHLRRRRRLAMLDAPSSAEAEPFRILRTNLEFANIDPACRSIMVTSAFHSEGKSTTAGNLAIALARAGAKVALLDLDLRRPSLHEFFDLGNRPGVTDVVLDGANLDTAAASLTFSSLSISSSGPLPASLSPVSSRGNGGGGRPNLGTLEVIGAGTRLANPGEFITTDALADFLQEVRSRADLLIVDGPPMLMAGDALMLSAKIEGMLIVARLNSFRRSTIEELNRFIAACPSRKLGLVVTGDSWAARHAYYYSQPRSMTRPQAARRSASGQTVR